MKFKTLFILLLLLNTDNLKAQYIEFQNEDLFNYLTKSDCVIEDNNFDKHDVDLNNDGKISTSEALQVTKLEINSSRYSDTPFVSLEELKIFKNLEKITLSGINDGDFYLNGFNFLEEIHISYSTIANITISNNPSLKKLNLPQNNIEYIILLNLPSLESLNLWRNSLTSLDLSEVSNLKELDCRENNITSINLNKTPYLEDCDISYNKLTTINLLFNTNLKTLEISGNKIKSLNLESLINLKAIECNSMGLDSLNLDSCPKLVKIECGNNGLTKLSLIHNANIESININNTNLSQINFSSANHLKNLTLYENKFEEFDISLFPSLERINLNNNNLKKITCNKSIPIKRLNLDHNKLNEIDFKYMKELKSIYISYNQLTYLDVSNLKQLESLSASENPLVSVNLKGIDTKASIYLNYYELKEIAVDVIENIYWKKLIPETGKLVTTYRNDFTKEEINTSIEYAIEKKLERQIKRSEFRNKRKRSFYIPKGPCNYGELKIEKKANENCSTYTDLIAPPDFNQYAWVIGNSHSSLNRTLTFRDSEDKVVKLYVSNNKCWEFVDSIEMKAIEPLEIKLRKNNRLNYCNSPKQIELETNKELRSISWKHNDQLLDESSKTIIIQNAGTYRVEVVDKYGCEANEKTHIYSAIDSDDIIFTPSKDCLNKGDTLNITYRNKYHSRKEGYFAQKWFTSDRIFISSEKSITISKPGVYIVEIENGNGCKQSVEVEIKECIEIEKFIKPSPIVFNFQIEPNIKKEYKNVLDSLIDYEVYGQKIPKEFHDDLGNIITKEKYYEDLRKKIESYFLEGAVHFASETYTIRNKDELKDIIDKCPIEYDSFDEYFSYYYQSQGNEAIGMMMLFIKEAYVKNDTIHFPVSSNKGYQIVHKIYDNSVIAEYYEQSKNTTFKNPKTNKDFDESIELPIEFLSLSLDKKSYKVGDRMIGKGELETAPYLIKGIFDIPLKVTRKIKYYFNVNVK